MLVVEKKEKSMKNDDVADKNHLSDSKPFIPKPYILYETATILINCAYHNYSLDIITLN